MKRSTYAIMLATIGAVLGVAAVSNAPSRVVILAQAPSDAPPSPAPSADKSRPDDPGFYAGEASLNASERAGREIWYKATAGNARFHTYVFPAARQRADRLVPGAQCEGARRPLRGVGNHQRSGLLRSGQRRTARQRASTRPTDSTGARATTSCSSSSAGRAIAIRRATSRTRRSMPRTRTTRPRTSGSRRAILRSARPPARSAFASSRTRASTRTRWLQGQRQPWRVGTAIADDCRRIRSRSDSALNRLADGSIEPPFLIGTACGSCHIAFDPLNPPQGSRPTRSGRTSRARSATSTRASRRS